MDEPIILYVDNLNEDESIGITGNPTTIAYNNTQIGNNFANRFTDVLTEVDSALSIGYQGRYIYTIQISLEHHRYGMIILDLKGDENQAEKMAGQLSSEDARQIFMAKFYEQRERYNDNYDAVKLKKGTPPTL